MDQSVGHNVNYVFVGHSICVGRPTWVFHDEDFLISSGTTYLEGQIPFGKDFYVYCLLYGQVT